MPPSITRSALALAFAGAIGIVAYVRAKAAWRSNRLRRNIQSWEDSMDKLREQYTDRGYEPLGEPERKMIRLMELLPGNEYEDPADYVKDPMRVSFRTVSLLDSQRESYEAISYCWGDSATTLPVSCDDGSYLWVTLGLFGALRQMRYKDRPRILWVDAVCINQADNHEKNWQVAQMGDIYRGAERVLIWLGDEQGLSQEMPKFISRLLKAKDSMAAADSNKFYLALSAAEIVTHGIPSWYSEGELYYALHLLTERPWFQRVWIIQELCQAREALVYCGTWCIPWERLSQAYLFMAGQLQLDEYVASSHGVTTMSRIVDLICTKAEVESDAPLPMLRLLVRHDSAKATDLRDRLFGLAGIADDGTDVEIDYGRSINDVYCDFAIRSMHTSNSLDVLDLGACRTRAVLRPGMPSWVPDWAAEASAESIYQMSTPHMEPPCAAFDATNKATCQLSVSSSGSLIQIRGLELDRVTLIGTTRPSNHITPPFWSVGLLDNLWIMMEWDRLCGAHSDKRYDLTGETMHQAFWHTLLLGTERHEWTPELEEIIDTWEASYKTIRLASNFLKPERKGLRRIIMNIVFWSLKGWTLPMVLRQQVNIDDRLDGFIRFTGWINLGRTFIMTDKGGIGVVTGQVGTGDVVVLLEGGKVPYILRRKVDENVFEFVGDCYLHGHMDGQSWDPDKSHMISIA